MKTLEKILLYPIGLCLWLVDQAKKIGKFIERKYKPAIAMLVAVTMMLSLMPMTAFAATGPSVIVGGVEMYSASGATYYVNGAAAAVTEAPANWNAKYESDTLTINNLSVMGTSEHDGAGIYAQGIDLTVDMQGANSIIGGDNLSGSSYGIYVNGPYMLTLSGSGALSVNGGTATEDSYGIYADVIRIQSGTINATGGTAGNAGNNMSCGIGGHYGVFIENGTINATGGAAYESVGIEICYEISGGMVVATGGNAVYRSYGITRGTNNTAFTGGVVVMRGGTFTSTERYAEATAYGYSSISIEGTKIAGQVVNGTFTGNLEEDEYDEDATALVIVPDEWADGSSLDFSSGAVTLDKDYYIVNANASALMLNQDTAVNTNGKTLLAASMLNGNSYSSGINLNQTNTLIVTGGGDVIAIASNTKSGTYGVNGKVNVSDGASVIAVSGSGMGGDFGVNGIYGTATVDGGTVTAIGGENSIRSVGVSGVTLRNGTVNAIGGASATESCGISGDTTVENGTLNAIGGSYGLSASGGKLQAGNFIGGTAAIYCNKGVNSLLANGYGYFAGDTRLTSDNSATAVGAANQTVTVKAMPHSHSICGDSSCSDNAHAVNDSWTAWDGTTAFPGGNVYLSDDVILSASISIADTVNLCLNGHTISAAGGNFDVRGTLNLCSCEDDGIIKRTTTTNALISADAGATANLYNVTLDGGAVWSGIEDSVLLRGTTNAGTKTGSPLIDAGYQRTAGGHITLNSGVVLQNNECSYAGDGGAVTIGEDGTLCINGAVIRNNAKTQGNAGAIKAYAGAQITLNSGEIYGNSAYIHGGAFQIFGGDSTDYADAVFTMNDGTIRNNKADGVGGGIAVSNYSQFIMNGGSIIDNATTDSQKRGGGVGFADENTEMSISGNAVIFRNSANNLYIGTNSCNKLTVGTLGSNANVGVTMKSSSGGVFTIGGAAYADKFTSDNSAYAVADDGNNLKLVKQFTVSFDKNGGTGSNDSVKVSDGDDYTLPSNPFTAPSGYQFKGWATSATGDVISTETIAVTADTTLYAIWEKIPAETPSVQVSDNLTLTYGEFTGQKFVAIVEQKDGYSYLYQWIDNNTVISTTNTLLISDDLAVGEYDYHLGVGAKRNDNGEIAWYRNDNILVNVKAKELNSNSADVTLGNTAFTYNGKEQIPAITVTYNNKLLTESTDYTISWPTDCKNVGLKTITVIFKGNYSGSVTKTFAIQKAPLTVTANNEKIIYGDAPTNNGVTYSGFAPNETEAVLNGTLSYDYTYSQYGDVGTYAITVSGLTSDNYDINFVPGTLTVQQKEIGISWGATNFIYNSTAQKPTAAATGTVNGDELTLTVSGEQTNASDTAYTATVTAINGEKEGNYKLPSNLTTNFTIAKADQTAPVVNKENETISKKADGKLTDVTEAMEYRAEGESTYIAITGNMVENLTSGKYFVRVKGDSNHNPSPDTAVIIAAGKKLKVIVPQNQVGYTLTTTTHEFDYYGTIRVEFNLDNGYSMTDGFEIYNGTKPIWQYFNQQTGVLEFTFVANDFELSVTGVADITVPAAEIEIKGNKWTEFWNSITFGIFFNKTQDVTISANDAGSGVNTIQYYLANSELERNEVGFITDWEDYNGTFKIDPNNRYIVYAKVTDNAGNTMYINSDGIILDNIVPTLEGIENGKTYYGDLTVIKSDDQFYDIKVVTLDGEPMGFNEGIYGLIPADNAEHIVVVEDYAGNKTIYTVTVYKNYTVTFKVDGNTVDTQTVGHGKDATAPAIPQKDGYTQTTPTWDKDGTNITTDTEINAVYTINEYTITFMDENGVYKTLTYKHGEAVTMPEVPTKEGYTVKWETIIDKATGDATIKAVYTEIPKTETPSVPQTGDNSNLWLWVLLLFASGGYLFGITLNERKRKATNR